MSALQGVFPVDNGKGVSGVLGLPINPKPWGVMHDDTASASDEVKPG